MGHKESKGTERFGSCILVDQQPVLKTRLMSNERIGWGNCEEHIGLQGINAAEGG